MPKAEVNVPKAIWQAIEAQGDDPETVIQKLVRDNLKPKRTSLTGDGAFRGPDPKPSRRKK